MTESKETTNNWQAELKAIFLLAFAIFGFVFVPRDRQIFFALLVTCLLLLVSSYIHNNKLKISRPIFMLIMALYNVISLFYMVQYFGDRNVELGIYHYAFYPFIDEGVLDIGYVIWIFVLSLFLLIYQSQDGRARGETYGR